MIDRSDIENGPQVSKQGEISMRRNVVRLGSTAEIRVVAPVWEDPAGEVAKGKNWTSGKKAAKQRWPQLWHV